MAAESNGAVVVPNAKGVIPKPGETKEEPPALVLATKAEHESVERGARHRLDDGEHLGQIVGVPKQGSERAAGAEHLETRKRNGSCEAHRKLRANN